MTLLGMLMGGRLNVITLQSVTVLIYLGLLSTVAYSLRGIILKYNNVSVENIIALILVSIGIVVVNKISN